MRGAASSDKLTPDKINSLMRDELIVEKLRRAPPYSLHKTLNSFDDSYVNKILFASKHYLNLLKEVGAIHTNMPSPSLSIGAMRHMSLQTPSNNRYTGEVRTSYDSSDTLSSNNNEGIYFVFPTRISGESDWSPGDRLNEDHLFRKSSQLTKTTTSDSIGNNLPMNQIKYEIPLRRNIRSLTYSPCSGEKLEIIQVNEDSSRQDPLSQFQHHEKTVYKYRKQALLSGQPRESTLHSLPVTHAASLAIGKVFRRDHLRGILRKLHLRKSLIQNKESNRQLKQKDLLINERQPFGQDVNLAGISSQEGSSLIDTNSPSPSSTDDELDEESDDFVGATNANLFYLYGRSVEEESPTDEDDEVDERRISVDRRSYPGLSSLRVLDYLKPNETFILLDWDDTLFPSDYLEKTRRDNWWAPMDGSNLCAPLFSAMSETCKNFLLATLELGTVAIVTLAKTNWVTVSAQKYYSSDTASIISNIRTHYAREVDPAISSAMFENSEDGICVGTSVKLKVMENLLTEFYGDRLWRNIICIGDGEFEKTAIREIVFTHKNAQACFSKTIKLIDSPSIRDLGVQLDVLRKWLRPICQFNDDIDIDFEKALYV